VSDLFMPPDPPENPYKPTAVTGDACYAALVELALCRWCWQTRYEEMVVGLCLGTNGTHPTGETVGRYLRFLAEKLQPEGWTVLNAKGRVCLCPAEKEVEMMKRLTAMEEMSR